MLTGKLILVVGGLLAVSFMVLFAAWAPRVSLVIGLLLYTVPMLQVEPGVDTRLGMGVIILGLLVRWVGMRRRRVHQRNGVLLVSLAALLITTAISLGWTVDVSQTVATFTSTAITFTLLWAARTIFTPRDLLWCVFVASGLLVISSLMMGIAGIGSSIEAGRLRGLFLNANALAIMALVTALASVVIRRRWVMVIYWGLVMLTLVWTASRAGTLATALFLVLAAWRIFSDWRLRALMFGVLVFSVVQLVTSLEESTPSDADTGLTRTNDSRSHYWTLALADIRRGMPLGFGGGSASVQGEAGVNVFLKAAYEFGWWGLVLMAGILLAILARTRGTRFGAAAFVAILANVQFEGWLFTFGNSFTVMTFLVLSALLMEKLPTTNMRRVGRIPRAWPEQDIARGSIIEART